MKAEVSIIIASYNNPGVLKDALRSLISVIQTPPIEVIVIDNASSAGNADMVETEFPNVHLFRNTINEGFGRACHRGAELANGEYLLFVNSDILLKGNPVPEMVSLFDQAGTVGVVGSQLNNPDGTKQPSYYRFPGLFLRVLQLSGLKNVLLWLFPNVRYLEGRTIEVDFVSGAFMMIPRDHYFEIGGFDKRFFMYLEDADLCFQSRRLKRKTVVLVTNNVVHLGKHYERASDPFVFGLLNKGLIIFFEKNYSRFRLYCLSIVSITFLVVKFLRLRFMRPGSPEVGAVRAAIGNYLSVFRFD